MSEGDLNTASSSNNKLGSALSGGGFRASLFHIGVLARMAMQQPSHAKSSAPIQMRGLKVRPMKSDADFHPEKDNHKRQAKVPILLINSTSLNTGGNWRPSGHRGWGSRPPSAIPLQTGWLRTR